MIGHILLVVAHVHVVGLVVPGRGEPLEDLRLSVIVGSFDRGHDLTKLFERDHADPDHSEHVAGRVDDGGRHRTRGRSAVEVDVDRLPQHLLRLLDSCRGRHTRGVRRADGERAVVEQQLDGVAVGGHAQRHGPSAVAYVPAQAGLLAADDGQRSRPHRLGELACLGTQVRGERAHGVDGSDHDRRRHVASASLGPQQAADTSSVEGVGGQAVHRVGRHDHECARGQRLLRLGEALGTLGRVVERIDRRHMAMVPAWPAARATRRALTKRGRPARSLLSRTWLQYPLAEKTCGAASP